MAKHRDLASVVYASTLGSASASKIWRTVVFAGAMLVTPMAVGCGGGKKPAPVEPAQPTEQPAATNATMKQEDDAAKAEADKKAAADAAAMEADKKAAEEKAAAEKAEADKKAAEEMAAKEEADKKAAEEAAKKKRPRGGGKARPTGRGFILS